MFNVVQVENLLLLNQFDIDYRFFSNLCDSVICWLPCLLFKFLVFCPKHAICCMLFIPFKIVYCLQKYKRNCLLLRIFTKKIQCIKHRRRCHSRSRGRTPGSQWWPIHVFGPDEEGPAALPGTTPLSLKSVQQE